MVSSQRVLYLDKSYDTVTYFICTGKQWWQSYTLGETRLLNLRFLKNGLWLVCTMSPALGTRPCRNHGLPDHFHSLFSYLKQVLVFTHFRDSSVGCCADPLYFQIELLFTLPSEIYWRISRPLQAAPPRPTLHTVLETQFCAIRVFTLLDLNKHNHIILH